MAYSIAVLVSGEGTNLQALIDQFADSSSIEICCVAANNSEAKALSRANEASIPTESFELGNYADRESRDVALADWISTHDVDLVVLAGYMQLLTPGFIDRFPRSIINIHPSLLPAFPGVDAIGQAIEYGVKVFGVTVHYVDHGIDTGEIIDQVSFTPSDPNDAVSIRAKASKVEHELLPSVVSKLAAA